jgi:hypothetical protein
MLWQTSKKEKKKKKKKSSINESSPSQLERHFKSVLGALVCRKCGGNIFRFTTTAIEQHLQSQYHCNYNRPCASEKPPAPCSSGGRTQKAQKTSQSRGVLRYFVKQEVARTYKKERTGKDGPS